jgi:hypothetical protein
MIIEAGMSGTVDMVDRKEIEWILNLINGMTSSSSMFSNVEHCIPSQTYPREKMISYLPKLRNTTFTQLRAQQLRKNHPKTGSAHFLRPI